MKCPKCQSEVAEGTRYCVQCGAALTPARKNPVICVLKALCYILLYLGVQSLISSIFTFFVLMKDPSILMSSMDVEAMTERLTELLNENLTMMLLVSNLVTILVISLIFTIRRKNPFEEVMLRPVPWKILPLCAVYGVALNVFVSITLSLLPLEALASDVDSQYSALFGQTNIVLEILNTAVITALVEEVVFRGLSISRMKRGMNRIVAIAVSAMIFGLFHGALLAICYATVLGVIFGLMTERYNSILPSVVCHMFFNATNFFFPNANGFIMIALYLASIAMLICGAYLLFRKTKSEEAPHPFE